jgi:DNA-binding XRE family transcriptional regulator
MSCRLLARIAFATLFLVPLASVQAQSEEPRSALGDRLRSARKRQFYSQQEAADHIGVHLRTYQGWEAGRSRPSSAKKMRALAAFLRMSPNDLYDDDE